MQHRLERREAGALLLHYGRLERAEPLDEPVVPQVAGLREMTGTGAMALNGIIRIAQCLISSASARPSCATASDNELATASNN